MLKRYLPVVGLPLILTACIPPIPLSLSIASTGFSGFSYLTSGKTTADHVLSAARDEDCALIRAASGEKICKEYEEGQYRPVAVVEASYPGDQDDWQQPEAGENWHEAKLETPAEPTRPTNLIAKVPAPAAEALSSDMISGFAGLVPPPVEPITVAGVVAGKILPRPDAKPTKKSEPVPAIEQVRWTPPLPDRRVLRRTETLSGKLQLTGEGRYLVIGSFRNQERARELSRRFGHLAPSIVDIKVRKRDWYRVAVGPLPRNELKSLKAKLGKIDGAKPWIVRM